MQKLDSDGVCVVPTRVFADPRCRADFLNEASNFPEFLDGVNKFVMGGFAALGNPSSFHNQTVRNFREWAQAILVDELFGEMLALQPEDWKLEQIMDRMTIRVAGETPSAESFHRDVSIFNTTDQCQIFGGWVNLDDEPQHFSCVLGSHKTGTTTDTGFVKISKEEATAIKKNKLATLVAIPPGAILVFHEEIVHEVLARKLRRQLTRLYLAWRLTPGSTAMRPGLQQQLDQQGIVTIKSGQSPPMHAKLHWVSQNNACRGDVKNSQKLNAFKSLNTPPHLSF